MIQEGSEGKTWASLTRWDTEYTLPAVIPSIRFFSSSTPGGFHSLLEVMTEPVFLKSPTGFNISFYYLVLMWGNDFNISSRQAGCAGVKLDMTSEIMPAQNTSQTASCMI